MNKIFM